MQENKLYGNISHTKERIKSSLLKLLSTKELSHISITELVKESNIYRATFYLHYRSIEAAILDIEDDVYLKYSHIRNLTANTDIFLHPEFLIELIHEFILEDKKYLKVIMNTNCFNRITLKLRDLLLDVLYENLRKYKHLNGTHAFDTLLGFITGGIVFAYRDWIKEQQLEEEKLKTMLIQMLAQIAA